MKYTEPNENCMLKIVYSGVSSHGPLACWRKRRACDVGEAKEGLENELWCRWSNWRLGEWAMTLVKRRKGWRMSCDLGEVTESLENELCCEGLGAWSHELRPSLYYLL